MREGEIEEDIFRNKAVFKRNIRDFPGDPVVENPPCRAGNVGSSSGLNTTDPTVQCNKDLHNAMKIPSAANKTNIAKYREAQIV